MLLQAGPTRKRDFGKSKKTHGVLSNGDQKEKQPPESTEAVQRKKVGTEIKASDH